MWLKMGLIRDDLGHLGHRSTHVQEFGLCPTGPEVTYLSLKLSKKGGPGGGPKGENGLFGVVRVRTSEESTKFHGGSSVAQLFAASNLDPNGPTMCQDPGDARGFTLRQGWDVVVATVAQEAQEYSAGSTIKACRRGSGPPF